MSVSFVVRVDRRGARLIAASTSSRLVQEQVDLVLGARRSRAARSGTTAVRSRTSTPRSSSPCQTCVASWPGRHEQHEVRVGREHRRRRRSRRARATMRSRCGADRVEDRAAPRPRGGARRCPAAWVSADRWYGQPHALQVVDDLGRREHVPDPRAGERERLRERAHDRDVRVVGDERQRALAAELDVGLVDDHERVRSRSASGADRVERLCVAGRVVRRADEDDVGRRPASASSTARVVEHERLVEPTARDLGVREPAEPRVQQVGRLERSPRAGRGRRRPAAAAVRTSFEPFAAHVPSTRVAVVRGELLAEPASSARRGSGSAAGRGPRSASSSENPSGQRVRALVRVQARGDVELRRDVRLDVAEARAGLGGGAHALAASARSRGRPSPSRGRRVPRRARSPRCRGAKPARRPRRHLDHRA